MFGETTSLIEYNSFLRKHGYRLKKPLWKSRGILLQEATIRIKSKNYAWVDKKVFYDLQDVILFANHLLLGTEGYVSKITSSSRSTSLPSEEEEKELC